MRLIKVLLSVILLTIAFTSSSFAACKWTGLKTETIRLPLGKIVVPPNAALGDVLYSVKQSITEKGYYYTGCKNSSVVYRANAYTSELVDNYNAYPTGVDGVGVRVTWVRGSGSSEIRLVFGAYTSGKDKVTVAGRDNLDTWNSYVLLELVRIRGNIGSGHIYNSDFGQLIGEKPYGVMLNIKITNSGTGGGDIVSPSCEVVGGPNINVSMGTVKLTEFTRNGSTVGNIPFLIKLKCGGSFSGNGTANVYTSFSGNIPTSRSNTDGVLVNDMTDGTEAKGIGVQVLKNGAPVVFDEKYFIVKLPNTETLFDIPLVARYYQYGDNPTPGNVESHMTYNITYD